MARGHGRILTSIWEDSDFLALTQDAQRLYLFLISQPNLNHAGLLPMTLRRWASKAVGLTPDDLHGDLMILDVAEFIVMDEDTEEILIRSFVRNDGVWKQPRVMGAMVSGAMEISSRRLRAALIREVDRIPVDELSDAPGAKGAPSIRAQVIEHIQMLRKAFGDITPPPPRGHFRVPEVDSETPCGGGSPTPSGTPSATPSDSPADGDPQGSTRVGASPRARALPLPLSPAPVPGPHPEGVAVSGAVTARASEGHGHAPIDDDGFALTDAMRRWSLQTFGPGIDIDHEFAQFIDYHRAHMTHYPNWHAAFQKWVRQAAKWATDRAARPPLRAVSGGHTPWTNPTDQSVYDEEL